MTSFYLSHLFTGPMSTYSHIQRHWRLELEYMNLVGVDTTHPITLSKISNDKLSPFFFPSKMSDQQRLLSLKKKERKTDVAPLWHSPTLHHHQEKKIWTYFLHLKSQITSALGVFSNLGQDLRIARDTTFALNFSRSSHSLAVISKKKERNQKEMLIKILLWPCPCAPLPGTWGHIS